MKLRNIAAVLAFFGAVVPANAQSPSDEALACGGKVEGRTLVVARAEAKCEWPFDVQKMQIRCNGYAPKMGEVYFASERGAYALNGSAMKSFKDPRPIWKDAPQTGMGKINVGPWIQVGLALC